MADPNNERDQARGTFRLTLPEKVRNALAAIDTDHTALELLRFLNDQVLREQELFWLRFYAFATLHAGAFVLATSSSVSQPRVVAIFGVLLGGLWALVQWLSLRYADRAKPDYNELRQKLGILWPHEGADSPNDGTRPDDQFAKRLLRQRRASSTDLGFWVAIVVLICWIAALFVLR